MTETESTLYKYFCLDGTWHQVGGVGECCLGGIVHDRCSKCGGLMHGQPIYGGYIDICDACDDVGKIIESDHELLDDECDFLDEYEYSLSNRPPSVEP